MKIQLKRKLIETVQAPSNFQVTKLDLEGIELEEHLKHYLLQFTEGILDPDISGKKPDRFVTNLKNGIFGDFSKRYIIVAQHSTEVIGILIGMPKEAEVLHIYALHVSPQYRNKRVGSTMLSKCINDMYVNNVRELILDVHIDNKPAHNFYKKFDFI